MNQIIELSDKKNNIKEYYSLKWEDILFRNRIEISTNSGRKLAWCLIWLLFLESNAFGLIPYKSLLVYRQVKLSDLMFLALMFYSFLNYKEIRPILQNSMFFKIILLLIAYISIELILSSFTYHFNIIEYFFRIIAAYKILIVMPFISLIKRRSLIYFTKRMIFLSVIMSFIYILNTLFNLQTLEGNVEVLQNIGGVVVKRIYGSTFGSDNFFLLLFFLFLIKKYKSLLSYMTMSILIAPTILAFGRNAWVVMVVSIILLMMIISIKKKSISNAVRGSFGVVIVLLIAFVLVAFFYSGFADLLYALSNRVIQGTQDVATNSGTFGVRTMLEVPALIGLWLTNPILGIGIHNYWALGSDPFMSAAFADVNWAAILSAYGVIGFILYIVFAIKTLKISYMGLKKVEFNSIGFFFVFLPGATVLTSLLNINNIFPLNIYLSYSCINGIIWGMPIIIEYYLNNHDEINFLNHKRL